MNKDNWFVLLVTAAILSGSILFGLAVHPLAERASEQRRQHGYEAGKAGLPPEACPYSSWSTNDYRDWKEGWIQGAKERSCTVEEVEP